jgi:putative glutamine amidotransferase
MARPLILITTGKYNQETPRSEVQPVIAGSNIAYVLAVIGAGGAPLLLPPVDDRETVRAAVETAAGILLTGGGDVMALAYGEEPHPASAYLDPTRDAVEMEVIRLAMERELPIFGVCRGCQVLNVALGGTLVQDIPTQVPGAIQHYSKGLEPLLAHTIDIEEGTLLQRLVGSRTMRVNTYHHQSIKDLGQGLRVNSRARDGVIEGIEAADGRPLLGVQCHPEESVGTFPEFRVFFDWLVREAGACQA